MSSKRRFNTNDFDVNIDPFNAPDPIMPGGEPDFLQQETRDIDGIERVVLRNERKEPGHSAHRARLPWKRSRSDAAHQQRNASPVRSESDEAPSHTRTAPDAAPTRRRPSPPRRLDEAGNTRGNKRKRGCGCLVFLLVMIIISSLGGVIASCSDSLEAGFEDSWSSGYTWSENSDGFVNDEEYYDYDVAYQLEEDFEDLCRDETRGIFDAMAAGDATYADLVVSGFTESLDVYLGISPADAGIDTAAIAQQALASIDYELDSAYAYTYASEDGYDLTCTVYLDFSMIDVRDLAYGLSTYVSEHEDLDQAIYNGALTEEDKQLLRDELARLMNNPEAYETFTYIDYVGAAELDGTELAITDGIDGWIDEFSIVVGNSSY